MYRIILFFEWHDDTKKKIHFSPTFVRYKICHIHNIFVTKFFVVFFFIYLTIHSFTLMWYVYFFSRKKIEGGIVENENKEIFYATQEKNMISFFMISLCSPFMLKMMRENFQFVCFLNEPNILGAMKKKKNERNLFHFLMHGKI
jgi:hypothetical protein